MTLAQTAQPLPVGLVLAGAGWTVRGPDPEPMAVFFLAYIPREDAGRHSWRLALTYANGNQIRLSEEVPGVSRDLAWEGEDEVVGLDDAKLTTPLTFGGVIALPPIRLPRGREYVWRLTVDGETRDGWVLPFRTTPPLALGQRVRGVPHPGS
jgi:hypothetical protein